MTRPPEYDAVLLDAVDVLWDAIPDAERVCALIQPVSLRDALEGMAEMAEAIRQSS